MARAAPTFQGPFNNTVRTPHRKLCLGNESIRMVNKTNERQNLSVPQECYFMPCKLFLSACIFKLTLRRSHDTHDIVQVASEHLRGFPRKPQDTKLLSECKYPSHALFQSFHRKALHDCVCCLCLHLHFFAKSHTLACLPCCLVPCFDLRPHSSFKQQYAKSK